MRINLYPVKAADGNLYVGEMLHEIAARDHQQEPDEERLVGVSRVFLALMEQLEQAARTESPVLLVDETGTGKELATGFIHRYSPRQEEPYVALDCAVITESLFESEVFGHEKRAFTGSAGARRGLFEVADGGTLFLDEIGEASLVSQAKLLRVLETGEFRRVGGNTMIRANARVVCATNRNLWEAVLNGAFRQDLYYRIACFCIRIPALQERLDDIPVLVDALLGRISRQEKRLFHLSAEAMGFLRGYDYPGNIRELRNILQVATSYAMQARTGEISLKAVRLGLQMRGGFERASVPQVAQALGVSERTLYRKRKRYGLSGN